MNRILEDYIFAV